MRIARVHICNYRSILDETIEFSDLTTFVGPNGSGKSAVLRAIDAFYSTVSILAVDDHYNRDASLPIRIAITYADLSDEEKQLFKAYVQNDSLTITKVRTENSEKYHGTRRQRPAFVEIRRHGRKMEIRSAYNELRKQSEFANLPTVGSADEALAQMDAWEQTHPAECQMIEDDGQFFGFRQVGQSRLERFTQFVFVPAVRDAERDAADMRGSPIFQLMELVVRRAFAENKDYVEFKLKMQQQYEAIVDPSKVPQLAELEKTISQTLINYVPSASVLLDWHIDKELDIPMPKADVRLKEDTFPCPVTRVGHGLQRAFILSLLQTLVSSGSEHPQGTAPVSTDTHTQVDLKPALIPHLILAIEEPELFQHPNRQRHLSKILLRLSQGEIPGVAKRTQVLYCTHSPLFVDLARFDSVRRFTKTRNPDSDSLPPITQVTANTLGAVAQKLSSAQDSPPSTPFTAQSLQGRMRALMTPWLNEGFFADVVVLVEGEDDRAAILGTASFKGEDLEKIGVSVIPCGGKDSLDRPLLAFSGFDIPTYTVFDGDRTDPKAVSTNRAILRLLGIDSPVDYPPTTVEKNYAVFETTLCKFLESNVPEEIYSLTVDQCKQEYGYPDIDRCRKSPVFIEMLLKNARRRDVSIPELEQMIDKILDLVRR